MVARSVTDLYTPGHMVHVTGEVKLLSYLNTLDRYVAIRTRAYAVQLIETNSTIPLTTYRNHMNAM
jgi:hypothetical protein